MVPPPPPLLLKWMGQLWQSYCFLADMLQKHWSSGEYPFQSVREGYCPIVSHDVTWDLIMFHDGSCCLMVSRFHVEAPCFTLLDFSYPTLPRLYLIDL